MASFELGGVAIALESGDGRLTQTYAPKVPGVMHPMADGGTVKQTLSGAVGKLRTVISGAQAWAPAALAGLDYTASMTLKCAEPRAVAGATVSIDIPAARRSDSGYTPSGYAVVNGALVETTISIVTNTCTLGAVSGASSYLVYYWPQLSVFASLQENLDAGRAHYGWSVTCEEI